MRKTIRNGLPQIGKKLNNFMIPNKITKKKANYLISHSHKINHALNRRILTKEDMINFLASEEFYNFNKINEEYKRLRTKDFSTYDNEKTTIEFLEIVISYCNSKIKRVKNIESKKKIREATNIAKIIIKIAKRNYLKDY